MSLRSDLFTGEVHKASVTIIIFRRQATSVSLQINRTSLIRFAYGKRGLACVAWRSKNKLNAQATQAKREWEDGKRGGCARLQSERSGSPGVVFLSKTFSRPHCWGLV